VAVAGMDREVVDKEGIEEVAVAVAGMVVNKVD
jgi:hypothetical protein